MYALHTSQETPNYKIKLVPKRFGSVGVTTAARSKHAYCVERELAVGKHTHSPEKTEVSFLESQVLTLLI